MINLRNVGKQFRDRFTSEEVKNKNLEAALQVKVNEILELKEKLKRANAAPKMSSPAHNLEPKHENSSFLRGKLTAKRVHAATASIPESKRPNLYMEEFKNGIAALTTPQLIDLAEFMQQL